jgi:hypothetical protein
VINKAHMSSSVKCANAMRRFIFAGNRVKMHSQAALLQLATSDELG